VPQFRFVVRDLNHRPACRRTELESSSYHLENMNLSPGVAIAARCRSRRPDGTRLILLGGNMRYCEGRALILTVLLVSTGAVLTTSAHASSNPPPPPVVNINAASAEQLKLLPRVGAALAQRIITRRERRAFRHPRELRRVRGIGYRTYRRLRKHVTVDGPTTAREKIR
jgi:competence protein ComEA